MTSITKERRAMLRRLKLDFDAAYAKVAVDADPMGDAYLFAQQVYKDWRRAIDYDGLALIDELDAAEEEVDRLRHELAAFKPRTAVPRPLTPQQQDDLRHQLDEMDDLMRLREEIGTPE